jgi:hypothetical protein
MTNNKDLEDYLNSIPGLPKQNNTQQSSRSEIPGEIDATAILQQRLAGRIMHPQNAFQPQGQQVPKDIPIDMFFSNPQQQNAEKVYLKEGFTYYKFVPAQESTVPIAMIAGPIANVSGKEFINKGSRKYYVVENHNRIDLSNPDYSKMKVLYAVEAPWVGTILVPESALIKQNNGQQLLKG